MKAFAVIGATGNQGGSVVRCLLKRGGVKVIGITRDPTSAAALELKALGVELRVANLKDADSLAAAISDADGLYCFTLGYEGDMKKILSVKFPDGLLEKECRALASAGAMCSKKKGGKLSHVVYSSGILCIKREGMPASLAMKADAADWIAASGVAVTVLQPSNFMTDDILLTSGVIRSLFDADKLVEHIAVEDIGYFGAMALFEGPEKWNGKVLPLAGDVLSFNQVCEVVSRVRGGHRCTYAQLPRWLIRLILPRAIMELLDYLDSLPPAEMLRSDLAHLRQLHPGLRTMEMLMQERGFDARPIPPPPSHAPYLLAAAAVAAACVFLARRR